jgi:hypothetical protein
MPLGNWPLGVFDSDRRRMIQSMRFLSQDGSQTRCRQVRSIGVDKDSDEAKRAQKVMVSLAKHGLSQRMGITFTNVTVGCLFWKAVSEMRKGLD